MTVKAVNAYGDDETGEFIVAFMDHDMNWQEHRLSARDAVTLADMLRLLTRTSD